MDTDLTCLLPWPGSRNDEPVANSGEVGDWSSWERSWTRSISSPVRMADDAQVTVRRVNSAAVVETPEYINNVGGESIAQACNSLISEEVSGSS